jgi:hypothetical protein
MIIEILARESPLTARGAFYKLKRLYGKDISYQAVHKFLKQMAEEKILEKRGIEYFLAVEWVLKLKRFSSLISGDYLLEKSNRILFEGFLDYREGIIRLLSKAKLVRMNYLLWPKVGLRGNATIICKACEANKLLAKIYEMRGFSVKFSNRTIEDETIITENCLYNIFYEPMFFKIYKEEIEKNFKKDEIWEQKLMDKICENHCKVELIRMENKQIAEKIGTVLAAKN